MRLLFYIPTLIGGGAERVTSIVCSELSNRGHEVVIATDIEKGHYSIADNIQLLSLYHDRNKIKLLQRISVICAARKIFKDVKPDIVVGVMPVFFLLARIVTLGTKIPVIASDHTSFLPNKLMKFRFIRDYCYKYASAVIVLTERDYCILGEKLPQKVVIPNPLSYKIIPRFTDRNKIVLAVGRLDVWKVKGFDVLIKIWSIVVNTHSDWKLKIAGAGSIESVSFVKKMIVDYNLQDSIELIGFQKNIDEVMRNSSIFVMTSRIEGFPMSLIEAMSQGCACISFSISGIIDEIITDKRNGILISDGDIDEYARMLMYLMDDKNFRITLVDNSLKSISRFSSKFVIDKWESLFSKLLKKK